MRYTWTELNNLLRRTHSESDLQLLLAEQRAAGANPRWLKRIWGRLKVLRNARERRDILAPYRGPRRKKEKV